MTRQFFRVYLGRGRNPRDFVAKVFAADAEEAVKLVGEQPAYKGKGLKLEAVPSHPVKKGK